MKFNNIYILILISILSGCKIYQPKTGLPFKVLPSNFTTKASDTTSIANINWRSFYGDDTLLLKLLDTALANNLDLKITMQRVEYARSQSRMAKAAQLPVVNANGTYWQRKFGYYTMDDAGNRVTEFAPGDTIPRHLPDFFMGLTTSWEVDVWGKLKNQKRAAFSNYLASREGQRFIISNLIAEISGTYYDLIALDKNLEILDQTIRKQQHSLEIIQFQKETGKANDLAVQQFEAQIFSSKKKIQETLILINNAENKINFLLGRFPQPVLRNSNTLFAEVVNQLKVGVPSSLLSNRPDIREAELQLMSSKFELQSAKANFLPSLNITAGFGFQAYSTKFLFISPQSIMYSAMNSIISPVINRGAIKAQYSMATSNQLSALYNYQKSIVNGFIEVTEQMKNIEILSEIGKLTQQQLNLLGRSIETSNELYRNGKASYLEVLLAQQNHLQAQLDIVETKRKQKIAFINLYKALGGG